MKKLKITVIKKFNPKDIFGHEMVRISTGKAIPSCYLEKKATVHKSWHDSFSSPSRK